MISDVWRKKVAGWVTENRHVLMCTQTGLLLFPVAVTTLAGIVFCAGGKLTAALWWGTVGLTVGWMLWRLRKEKGQALLSIGLFFLFLAGVWGITNSFIFNGGLDQICYHLPGIRLLIEGWNPVTAATPETIAASMAVDPWEMRLWHVLCMPKGTAYFNAAAYFFTGAAFNLLFPIFPFLLVAAFTEVWRLLRDYPALFRIGVLFLLAVILPSFEIIVDAVISLAGIGLISAMVRMLRGETDVALSLAVCTFWMAVTKQLGLLTAAVFWGLFLLLLLVRDRKRCLKAFCCGCCVVLPVLTVCVSPYLTAWVNYHHPLYPVKSADESRFPIYNITADFENANADAKAMGHLGAFIHAYIAPKYVHKYYEWKLDQPAFSPYRAVWVQGHHKARTIKTPLSNRRRWRLLGAFILFFLFAPPRLRWVGVFTAAGLFVFPTSYLGFERYILWIRLLQALAVALPCYWVWKRFRWARLPLKLFAIPAVLYGAYFLALAGAINLTAKMALDTVLASPPRRLYASLYEGALAERFDRGEHLTMANAEKIYGDPAKIALLQSKLLCREDDRLRQAEVCSLPVKAEKQYPYFLTTGLRLDPMLTAPVLNGKVLPTVIPTKLGEQLDLFSFTFNAWKRFLFPAFRDLPVR